MLGERSGTISAVDGNLRANDDRAKPVCSPQLAEFASEWAQYLPTATLGKMVALVRLASQYADQH